MKTYSVSRTLALFCTAFATVFGLCSCEKEKNGDDPGTEPPVKLEDQIQYDGGALVDINSAIYEVEDTDLYTFYLSPVDGIAGVGDLEDSGEEYLAVTVRNPGGTVDTENDEFSVSYRDVTVRKETMNDVESISLSADLVEQTSVLNLYVEVTLKSGKTLLARYNSTCTEAALAELSNQYELDGTINTIGSAVAWRNMPEQRTVYYFYSESGVTEPSGDKTPAFTIDLSESLLVSEDGTFKATVDLATADPADISVACGDFTTGDGTVTGTLTLSEEIRSQREFLVVSLDATAGGRRLRAECSLEFSCGYDASGMLSLTPAGEGAEPVKTALSRVFLYSANGSNSLMFGPAEADIPEDLKDGGFAVRFGLLDSQIGQEVVPGTGCTFYLYDYKNYTTTEADDRAEGTVYVDKVGDKTYMYASVTFSDGTSINCEWYGVATAVTEDPDLTPVEPVRPRITVTDEDGIVTSDVPLRAVQVRMEKDYKLRGGDPAYGGATFDAYFFYFLTENVDDSSVETTSLVPQLMIPVSAVGQADIALGQMTTELNWSFKYTYLGVLQYREYTNKYNDYAYCPEDAVATVIQNPDKTWYIKFSMTDAMESSFGIAGSKNNIFIEWDGPASMYTGSKTNDLKETDY